MGKGGRREERAVLRGLEGLQMGVAFDSHDLRKLPFRPSQITRVVNALLREGVIARIGRRKKYLLANDFRNLLKEQVLQKTPRSGNNQIPPMTAIEVSGMEHWSELEVDRFVRGLRDHWQTARRKQP